MSDIDHTTCPDGSHTFDAGDPHYEGRVDEYGNTRCNDCDHPTFYCTVDDQWYHVGTSTGPCMLADDGGAIPAPRAGSHVYEPDAFDVSRRHCILHPTATDCPVLDLAALVNGDTLPAGAAAECSECHVALVKIRDENGGGDFWVNPEHEQCTDPEQPHIPAPPAMHTSVTPPNCPNCGVGLGALLVETRGVRPFGVCPECFGVVAPVSIDADGAVIIIEDDSRG